MGSEFGDDADYIMNNAMQKGRRFHPNQWPTLEIIILYGLNTLEIDQTAKRKAVCE